MTADSSRQKRAGIAGDRHLTVDGARETWAREACDRRGSGERALSFTAVCPGIVAEPETVPAAFAFAVAGPETAPVPARVPAADVRTDETTPLTVAVPSIVPAAMPGPQRHEICRKDKRAGER